jgi:drug/metabolite transporter (DMT)-like permease
MDLRARSFAVVLLAATLWGLSGTAAQGLFDLYGFPPLGLVTLRMLLSAAILLAVVRPSFPRGSALHLLVFSVLGLLAVQVTYFLAIANSNAPTATLLQSLALPMMAIYEWFLPRARRTVLVAASVGLAFVGTLVLTVGGTGGHLAVSFLGVTFGVLSALTAAYYTIDSRPLVQRHGAWAITAWGMLIGGLLSLPLGAPGLAQYLLHPPATGGMDILLLTLFVVVAGTLVPFGLYLQGRDRLSAIEAGVAGTMEPVSAAVVAFVVLGVVLQPLQYLGGALMLVAVVLIAGARPPKPPDVSRPPKG